MNLILQYCELRLCFLYTFSMDLGALKYTFPMKIVGKKYTFPIYGADWWSGRLRSGGLFLPEKVGLAQCEQAGGSRGKGS